ADAEVGVGGDLYFDVGGDERDSLAFLAQQHIGQNRQGVTPFDDASHDRQWLQQRVARGFDQLHVHPLRVCSSTCRLWFSSACLVRASDIFLTACRTVVWSRPPKRSPISGRLFCVSSLARYMAICRGRAILA